MTRGRLIRWIVCIALFGAMLLGGIIKAIFYPEVTFERAVGVSLPLAATEFRSKAVPGLDGGEYFACAKMSEQDFLRLMAALQLQRNPPDLQQFPGALRAAEDPSWWSTKDTARHDTYFVLRATKDHDSYIAAKYEDGRMYLRRSYW